MDKYKYVFGPVPSRRLGLSVGVSPIPLKYCNYSCIYCQLGRTHNMLNQEKEFFPHEEIIKEVANYLQDDPNYDVITIVGEGEPTLYSPLGELISEIKRLTTKPIAVITNGSRLNESDIRRKLALADLVLPSLDAYDEDSFRKINRAFGKINFSSVYEGLRKFSQDYKGQLWLEIMLIPGVNDDEDSLYKFQHLLKDIDYDRLFINTPVRPPAEEWVKESSEEVMQKAMEILGGIAINALASQGFGSEIIDDYEAIISIIKRHPMNQHEIKSFLDSRSSLDFTKIIEKLKKDTRVEIIKYKNYETYRYV